jgi:hypothetical protein
MSDCDADYKQAPEGDLLVRNNFIRLGYNSIKPDKLRIILPSQTDLGNCIGKDGLKQEGYSQKASNLKQYQYLTILDH